MLSLLRKPIAMPSRAMPDLLDRTRLAAFAVLAAFAALSLTIVGHLAATGVPLPIPGLPGEGLILPASEAPSSSRAGAEGQSSDDSVAGEADFTIPPAIPSTSDGVAARGGDRGGQGTGQQVGAPDTGAGPRQVGISVGSTAPSAPAPATPAPGATTPPATGAPGTGTSGGSPGDTAGDGTASVPGPDNNWGHNPVAPAGDGSTTETGSSGASVPSNPEILPDTSSATTASESPSVDVAADLGAEAGSQPPQAAPQH